MSTLVAPPTTFHSTRNMELTITLDEDAEHAISRVAEESERPDGDSPTPEELAEQVVRQFAAQEYQQIVMDSDNS